MRPSRRRRIAVGFALLVAVLFLGTFLSPTVAAPTVGATSAPGLTALVTTTVHDLNVTSFNVTVPSGDAMTFYATLPSGVSSVNFHWSFGDGLAAHSTTGVESHLYRTPGTYAVFAQATDTGAVVHDNLRHILIVGVAASFTGDVYGNLVELRGTVASNSSTATHATALIGPGDAATVRVSVITGPESTLSAYGTPSFNLGSSATPYASFSAVGLHAAGTSTATATFASTTPFGLYRIWFSDPTVTPVNGSSRTAWSNYSFTIVVGTGLGGASFPVTVSPHPGTLAVDEPVILPESIDPAVAYSDPGTEIVSNVYQELIYPNGTSSGPYPNDFNPGLAVCVPGSPACTSIFGKTLISGNSAFFTFVINPGARFFDNATGSSFPVYPSDVMFSVARLLAFADLPFPEEYPGWIMAQALLPLGNPAWDSGTHYPYNNTPSEILDSMYVNNSNYCPAIAMSTDHGCITFVTKGSGQTWPYFLAMIGNPVGNFVEPCGWFSNPTQGAGLPSWPAPLLLSGDAPCLLPGGTTSTSAPAFHAAVAAIPPTGWDAYELSADTFPGVDPGVQWRSVGSGPYYAFQINNHSGYVLMENPKFVPNPYCTWSTCEPTAGTLYKFVEVHFVTDSTANADLANGSADIINPASPSYGTMDGLVASGAASVYDPPTLAFDNYNLNLEYNPALAASDFGRTFSAPSTLLDNLSVRQFFVTSFPSAEIESDQAITQGISTFYLGGSAIPQRTGNYYPSNVSWPQTKPDVDPADVGGAGWWFAQASGAVSADGCAPSTPCTFPVVYVEGTTQAIALNAWAGWISKISGAALKPIVEGQSFIQVITDDYIVSPGQNVAVIWPLGWLPDYADPTDVVTPYYQANATYTYPDAVEQELGPLDSPSCSTSITHWSSLSTPIPNACQGAAFDDLDAALTLAATSALGAPRTLLYNEAEHIARALALYPPQQQLDDAVHFVAPWVNANSLAEDPLTESAQVTLWFDVRALSVTPTPLSVRGVFVDPNPVALGSTVVLYALGTGGTGGYTYFWSGATALGCSSSTNATLSCVTSTTGTFSISVKVQDASLATVTSATVSVTVTDIPRSALRRAVRLPRSSSKFSSAPIARTRRPEHRDSTRNTPL